MEFEKRLEQAIQRGQRESNARARDEARRVMSERELRRLYSQHRIELSEHIESCLRHLADHLPGFQYETIVDERGWGGAVGRSDLQIRDGSAGNAFSRLEIVVRPLSASHVLELASKGTVRNRELYNRSHYQPLGEVDITTFREMVDHWVLEYAEAYAGET